MLDIRSHRWQCWLFGHQADPIASQYGWWDCRWCQSRDDDPVLVVRFDGLTVHLWRLWWCRLREPLWRWWRSFDRCPKCQQPERWGCMAWCDYEDIPF